ncbi:UvrABC system protein A [Planctomycetales bacterium]|nr:UvrABC system protein A [Planctomycetales bacterium]GHS99366.1 UvrABC system protein A [Planctomycetales bacterium]GHT02419.1 UvrABC system protein A [Planctomycetales bacterium]
MSAEFIEITGAGEHNLRRVNLKIPRDCLCVITGLSGSGKSSLAFDTIFAEGQRRYIESLSAYARQFLHNLQKPNVEQITGLPPTIAIEQRKGQSNPRSTVATITEIYDYMRLLYARAGDAHCPHCGKPIAKQTPQQIVDNLLALGDDKRAVVYSPLVRGRKGEYREELKKLKRDGYLRIRLDGELREIADLEAVPHKNNKHHLDVVIDRLTLKRDDRLRLAEAVEKALAMSGGLVVAAIETAPQKFADTLYSARYGCLDCNFSFPDLEPRMFSFNTPYGACPVCDGLGHKLELDPGLIVPDPTKKTGAAVAPWRKGMMAMYYNDRLRAFARAYRIDLDTPFADLPAKIRHALIYGDEARDWEGVIPDLHGRFHKTDSDGVKEYLNTFMSSQPCPQCGGERLKPEALAVKIGGENIAQFSRRTVVHALDFIEKLRFDAEREIIAAPIKTEVRNRLNFLVDVGLDYLTLDRMAGSLSGGEAQRIRLASQVGSGLVGVCYVLDEPTIGLHQRDNDRLLATLRKMQQLGNSVIVVEHDEDVIRAADYLVDVGPGAGAQGGEIVAAGTVAAVAANPASVTGRFLCGAEKIAPPAARRPVDLKNNCLKLSGASGNNLRRIDAVFPLGVLTCVTGVSGSGKSTLVTQTLSKILQREINRGRDQPAPYDKIAGLKNVDKVIIIDQSPVGKTSRSNPATYTGAFGDIRDLFAKTPEAQLRGYAAGRFSFNALGGGGRCAHCQGAGEMKIEMHFLPDVFVPCEHCGGTRYNRETLEVKYKGKNIAEVLAMTIAEAGEFFAPVPMIRQKLSTLVAVGLDYIALGQSTTTLSGGEAQRMKLSAELAKRATGRTVYILDEPTTGLHFADIRKLLDVLNRLIDRGNTAIIIEHNLDVIKSADWLIDLGPEGGARGGQILVAGTPETVAQTAGSFTGKYLARVV